MYHRYYFWLVFICFCNSFNFRFVLALLLELIAHKAAGNQPNKVHCKTRHIIPDKILPLNKKDNHGNKIDTNI